jgi:enoyl-[acyl-carrier protein] reductase II
MVLKAGDRSTVVTGRCTGHPVRCLSNKLTREMIRLENEGIDPGKFEKIGAGALAKAVKGDIEGGSVMAGQIAGLVSEIKPCRDIIVEIVEDAEKTVKKVSEDMFGIEWRS